MSHAGKQGDLIIGIDKHDLRLPNNVVLPGVPTVCIGVIEDDNDNDAGVFIRGLPIATAGSNIKVTPHLPLPKSYDPDPGHNGAVEKGSSTVFSRGQPVARHGDPVVNCHTSGKPAKAFPNNATPSGNQGSGSKIMANPSGVIIGGSPVDTVKGPQCTASAPAQISIRNILRRKKEMDEAKERGEKPFQKKVSSESSLAILSQKNGEGHKQISRSERGTNCTGDPVDIASGCVTVDQLDFELPGPIPLRWERIWESSEVTCGELGQGWRHSYDQELIIKNVRIYHRMGEGRLVTFPKLTPEDERSATIIKEHLTLRLISVEGSESIFELEHDDGQVYHFRSFSDSGCLKLVRISDRFGHEILFFRDQEGMLEKIIDSVGRILEVQHEKGLIRSVSLGELTLARYSHGSGRVLESAEDASGAIHTFRYQKALLTERRFPNGYRFFYKYDDPDKGVNARCVHVSSDCGILERRFSYIPEGRQTFVEDSKGDKTTFYAGSHGMIRKQVDSSGRMFRTSRDGDCRVWGYLDHKGRETSLSYNKKTERLDYQNIRDVYRLAYAYDEEERLTRIIRNDGRSINYSYDSRGLVSCVTDTLGNSEHSEYNQDGSLKAVIDPEGNRTSYEYDDRAQIIHIHDAVGTLVRLEYDDLGRVTKRTDGEGHSTLYCWDSGNRLIRLQDESGGLHHYSYDAEGNLLSYQDAEGKTLKWEYGPLGRITKEFKPDGQWVSYEYDSELNLSAITRLDGLKHTFSYDQHHRVISETDFFGQTTHFSWDELDRLSSSFKAGEDKKIEFSYDDMDRISEVRYSPEESESFTYDLNGQLLSAKNAHSEVSWTRNLLGQSLSEKSNGKSLFLRYDKNGRLVFRSSEAFFNVLKYKYDPRGQLKQLIRGNEILAGFSHNLKGQLTESELPGNLRHLQSWLPTGECASSRTIRPGREDHKCNYQWSKSGKLLSFTDNFRGESRFDYHTNGHLERVIYPEGSIQHFVYKRMSGDTSSSPFQASRSELPTPVTTTKAGSFQYHWDPSGRLEKKTGKNSLQVFSYNAAGKLSRVSSWKRENPWEKMPEPEEVVSYNENTLKPGQMVAHYLYDALGRRIEKRVRYGDGHQQNIRFHWEGMNLLGEIREGTSGDQRAIEHVYHPDSFEPLCQLESNKNQDCFFINDHRGAPRAVYNRDGKVVWECELGAFGDVRWFWGLENRVSWRLQGQYFDPETGLHYNLHRYFDPVLRGFTSPDPIGLAGGLELWNYPGDPHAFIDPLGLATKRTSESCGSGGINSILNADIKPSVRPQKIDPNRVNFSQSSVNGAGELIQSMKQNGWKGSPIDVVKLKDGTLVTIDNTRVLAASKTGIQVQATVHDATDKLPTGLVERFMTPKGGTPSTWGEAVLNRIRKQKKAYKSKNPQGSFTTGSLEY